MPFRCLVYRSSARYVPENVAYTNNNYYIFSDTRLKERKDHQKILLFSVVYIDIAAVSICIVDVNRSMDQMDDAAA